MSSHLKLVTAEHDREIQIAEAKAIVTDLRTALDVAERLLARLRAPTASVRTRTVNAQDLTPGDVVLSTESPHSRMVVRSVQVQGSACLVGIGERTPQAYHALVRFTVEERA